MQFKMSTGGVPVPRGLPRCTAARPSRSLRALCLRRALSWQRMLLLGRARIGSDCRSALSLECHRRFLKNIAAFEEQHDGQERAD